MKKLFLYPIFMGDVAPHYTLQKAFEKHFDCFTYDWVNIATKIGLHQTQVNFLKLLREQKPEYCFMQLQNPDNMGVDMVREMSKHTKIIHWTGDVRGHKEWYDWFVAIGKEVFITLFSNATDVETMATEGVNADYLQVGYDTAWYNTTPDPSYTPAFHPEIVMCANGYDSFPNSKLRADAVLALREEFGDKFQIFGQGWNRLGIKTVFVDNQREANLYRNAKIAISISNFNMKRYWSDRLPRIMACGGAVALSHNFPDWQKDFVDDHNLYIFNDIEDIINRCHYILNNEGYRLGVVENALITAESEHTWDNRCLELIEILDKC